MSVFWEDMVVDVAAVRSGGTAPAFTKILDNGAGSTGIYLNQFAAGANKDIHFVIQVPHSWAEGTDLMPHVHWMPASSIANTGTVIWKFEYAWVDTLETIAAATSTASGTYTSSGVTPAGVHKLTHVPTAGISGAGHTVSSIVVGRLGRLGADDTSTANINLLAFDIHYQRDNLGSINETSKP